MNDPKPESPLWKRLAILALWLLLAPPVGLWKLWADKTLSSTLKWRIIIYVLVLPTMAYLAFSAWMTNQAMQKFMP